MNDHRTGAELEAELGEQLRAARVRNNVSQATLAQEAGVAVTALRRLELGQGATVSTLVSVVRALGRHVWLDSLQPTVTISPLQMLKSTRPRQRSGSPHKPKTPSPPIP
jgi:transcriptional regulator with XRE-family HTH domain